MDVLYWSRTTCPWGPWSSSLSQHISTEIIEELYQTARLWKLSSFLCRNVSNVRTHISPSASSSCVPLCYLTVCHLFLYLSGSDEMIWWNHPPALNILPSSLFINIFQSIVGCVHIINTSLVSGHVAASLKDAFIHPLLKKLNWAFSSKQPQTNLKITVSHWDFRKGCCWAAHSCLRQTQSGLRRARSTETALTGTSSGNWCRSMFWMLYSWCRTWPLLLMLLAITWCLIGWDAGRVNRGLFGNSLGILGDQECPAFGQPFWVRLIHQQLVHLCCQVIMECS